MLGYSIIRQRLGKLSWGLGSKLSTDVILGKIVEDSVLSNGVLFSHYKYN